MLFFACGGMDESHNIVLPYSWPTYSEMGGEPVQGSPAIKESEYCHALIHRYFTHFFKIFTIFKKGMLGGGAQFAAVSKNQERFRAYLT